MILVDKKFSFQFFSILSLLFYVFTGCHFQHEEDHNNDANFYHLKGNAQGSTFSIIYQDTLDRDFSEQINSILTNYDLELSTYVDSSLVSKINREYTSSYCSESCFKENELKNSYFHECFLKAKEVYFITNGKFNPAIYPLVEYWGFFDSSYTQRTVDKHKIDSLLTLVSFDNSSFYLTNDTVYKGNVTFQISPVVCKVKGNAQLDFNGIAQGHSVDVVSQYLDSQNIKNYMVEIGGEIKASGVNQKSSSWKIGIDKPVDNSSPGSEGFQVILGLKDNSLATSGNYRKFYKKGGIRYSHTIDPESGYPVQHSLLSVTVICDETSLADAYATAFMVMGIEESMDFINSHTELKLEAYFVYGEEGANKIWMTEGMKNYIQD